MLNLSNSKRKDKKFSLGKLMMKIVRKDLEEQPIKSKDITDVQFKLAKDHMDLKALSISI